MTLEQAIRYYDSINERIRKLSIKNCLETRYSRRKAYAYIIRKLEERKEFAAREIYCAAMEKSKTDQK